MYENLIHELNPKPRFNLKWYNNQDSYSEGDIEDLIINIIARNEPDDYVQEIAENFCWSTYYHLNHIRKNILNWYPFSEDASILEIGCGMGAITNLLCEKCKDVTAVELSKRRAAGALLRCRERENLEIIVGNLNDIQFEKKFDYITLIGVLEYQGSYTDTANPYQDFLRKVKGLLKENGKLLIAIENQYGLKYWCGAREDHTSIPFDGINQYTFSDKKVRTFSKNTLDRLIKDSGFKNTFFYYPMPDYKLPTVIYSQEKLPWNEGLMNVDPYYIPDRKTLVADERKLYGDILQNGVFEFFANSFLVECSDSNELGDVTFATLPSVRLPEYQLGTKFTKEGEVIKFSMRGTQARVHIENILRNERELQERGLKVWSSEKVGEELHAQFLEAKTLEQVLCDAYKNHDAGKVYAILDEIYAEILQSSDEAPWQDNILYTFDMGIVPDKDKYGTILKTGYIDMMPKNAFMYKDSIYWFDQEWTLENVPAGYIMYRILKEFFGSMPDLINQTPSLSELIMKYNIVNNFEVYNQVEGLFTSVVVDTTDVSEKLSFCGYPDEDVINSINKILNP